MTNPTLVISLAARPGVFGQTVHNAGYAALGLDYQYKPMECHDLAMSIQSVRNLGIRGASLTMPFKVQALQYVDELSPIAKSTGAINTIVNNNGHLTGHNTDVIGARDLMNGYQYMPWLVLGTGGMARAFLEAAKMLAVPHVYVTARNESHGKKLAAQTGAKFVLWEARELINGCAILNATPIGMAPNIDEAPIDVSKISPKLVFDAVPKPVETQLVRAARAAGVPVVLTGRHLALTQAFVQFELYTGQPAPRDAMIAAAKTVA